MNYSLAMSTNYITISQDEMMYLDGGALGTYSGATGWALAAALTTAGGILAGASGAGLNALVTAAAGLFAGGPAAWIGAALAGAALGGIGLIGGAFLDAGKDAAWYMGTSGEFSLSLGNTPWTFITASN